MLPPPSLRRAQTSPDANGVPLLPNHLRLDETISATTDAVSASNPSGQGIIKTTVPSWTTNRMYLQRQRSKRDLLRARTLSRRVLRTLSEMIIEEDTQEGEQHYGIDRNIPSTETSKNATGTDDTVAKDGRLADGTVPPAAVMPDFLRSASTSSYLLKRSLSKRLIDTLSECIIQHDDGKDEEGVNKSKVDGYHGSMDDQDEEASSSEGSGNYDFDFEDNHSVLLVRSVSKRLIRTISQLFEDESTEASLDIFADLGSFHTEDSRKPIADDESKVDSRKCGTSTEEDGFDKFLMSLKNDDGFHNSLNDWMGSLSDIFDRKIISATQGGLTEEDCRAMDMNVKRMTDVGQYLKHSLSCRKLMKSRQKEPKIVPKGFPRQLTGTSELPPPPPRPPHPRPEPFDYGIDKNNAPVPIRLLSPPKVPTPIVVIGEAKGSGTTTMGFHEGQCQNAAQPVRLPSPQDSRTTLNPPPNRNLAGLPVLPADS